MINWLLLGPTGVGKTTLGQLIAPELGLSFVDLDAVMSQVYQSEDLASCLPRWGAELFLQRSLACLAQLERQPERQLVVCGAGSQWADAGRLALLNYPGLCLWAEPRWLWERNGRLRQDPRPLEKFLAVEYGLTREALYQGADLKVDITGLNLEQAQALILQELAAHGYQRPPL